ncbi:MAG: class I SAM-dependent methyltransferase, partial [Cyclobacteriaceae bacterium]
MKHPEYHIKEVRTIDDGQISSFISEETVNIDEKVVNDFGEEWTKFDSFSEEELEEIGNDYFDIVPPELFTSDTKVIDIGCGSGRWSKYVAPKVGIIEAVDPSHAVLVARRMLEENSNARVTHAEANNIPFEDNTFDFGFSLGVLHHIPDTQSALNSCVSKIKPGGHFLVYFYYRFDNRGSLFKFLFGIVNLIRAITCRLPGFLKKFVCDLIALLVYWPLSRFSLVVKSLFGSKAAAKIPLSYYADKSMNIIRNDALDRFGTRLEKRFTRKEITGMMTEAGLTDIVYSDNEPSW